MSGSTFPKAFADVKNGNKCGRGERKRHCSQSSQPAFVSTSGVIVVKGKRIIFKGTRGRLDVPPHIVFVQRCNQNSILSVIMHQGRVLPMLKSYFQAGRLTTSAPTTKSALPAGWQVDWWID